MSYKICYVTTLPKTLREFILDSAKYNLKNSDWDITFISGKDTNIGKEYVPGIKYLPINIKRGISFSGVISVIELFFIFKKEKFDLVQYTTANAACYASIAAKLANVPIRIYSQWGIGFVYLNGIKKFLKKSLEKIICFNSTIIQPDSKENLKIAIEEGLYSKEKGMVVGNGSACGVDLIRFDISKKEEWRKEIREKFLITDSDFVFGYAGRMLGDKGLNELFSAFEKLLENDTKLKLLLVGGTDVVEKIDPEKWEWANKCDNVILSGYTKEVEKYYAAMDCFVFPSYHEGFGSVTIEAESMNVPVIVTDIPGSREAMKKGETGIAVRKMDEKSLYDAMLYMKSNPSKKDYFSKNGRKFVTDYFDKEKLCENIYKNKKELLERL